MKKQSLIMFFALSIVLVGANFKSDKDQFKASVIIKKDTIEIEKNKIVKLSDVSEFTFEFKMPSSECHINVYASDKKEDYYKFLEGAPTSTLQAFKRPSGFSIAENGGIIIKDELIVSDQRHQPYIFDNPEYTSFRRIKTIGKNNFFYCDIKEIVFDDIKDSIQKCTIQEFQSDTIYFIVEPYYNKDGWKNNGTTAFKMALR